LETFTPEKPKLSFQEIVQRSGLPRTTVFRLLGTLNSLNYVYFDKFSKKYFPGPKVMCLGFATLETMDLKEIARPYLEEFSALTNEDVNLGVLDRTRILYIDRIKKKRQRLNTGITVGLHVNAYLTAIGRAILAFMKEEDRDETLDKLFSDPEVLKRLKISREEFLELLKTIRQTGYALVNEEFLKGIRSIGVPILDSQGYADAAINLPVFTKNISLKKLTGHYGPMLMKTAGRISANRGYLGAYPAKNSSEK
jgi:IclR family pca regulon transcriptional regulator